MSHPAKPDLSTPVSRRSFFRSLGLATAVAGATGGGGYAIGKKVRSVSDDIANLTLPKPAVLAPALPAGVEVGVDGIESFITSNADFYRIDTALTPPSLSTDEWELKVHGMVDEEFSITFDELLGYDFEEHYITMTCVSNEVGGDLVGTAKWLGYPLHKILERAKPQENADMLLSMSIDGFTASSPLDTLMDPEVGALLVIAMNDEPLPIEHGFPVRMIVPGLYGFVSATKWVVDWEVTRFDQKTAYWTDRNWAEKAPIKTASRIDVPTSFQQIPAGDFAIGGVAWAQTRGISKVEVQVDNEEWQEAKLGVEGNKDLWRQWSYVWAAQPGLHTLRVRATDVTGETQTEERVRPIPNGSSGWQSVQVTVT